ncbi:MAG TPA: FHA domain-containing serine/threonine-protein kinase [Thermoanaerobaculia bacterium]|nr:FHA domain-containing serine/threonine-protein kinase [Thermoanaerobaculia bacterium]
MIGSVIGSYRVERELGEGGMSHVYVGRTITPTAVLPEGYLVVLKVMSAELAGEQTARKRFVKEAQILSQLRHRYITRFYEFIARETGAVLVMEFVDGKPVDQIIAEKGALPVPEAISIAECMLEALAYAHGRGIIHRDIKPANLIQQKTGALKVTDFGIAKIKEGSESGQTVLTKAGFLLGTPHYMSPEQIRDPKEAGALCDVYSSAVVLYEMLTGSLPFTQRSLPKLIDAIYRGDKKPLSAVRPSIDPALDALVLRGMHADPTKRFGSAETFRAALDAYKTTRLAPASGAPAGAAADATVRAGAPPEPARPSWDLVGARESSSEVHPLAHESVTIGRDRSCAIVLGHPAVSRKHAIIIVSDSSFVLEDLKSANGTYVNNTRVERAQVKPGDIIRFGADPACSYTIRPRH